MKDDRAEQFALFDTISSVQYAEYEPDDPKYVVDTSRVKSVWLHWPGLYVDDNTVNRNISIELAIMLHFRDWYITNGQRGSSKVCVVLLIFFMKRQINGKIPKFSLKNDHKISRVKENHCPTPSYFAAKSPT